MRILALHMSLRHLARGERQRLVLDQRENFRRRAQLAQERRNLRIGARTDSHTRELRLLAGTQVAQNRIPARIDQRPR